MNDYCEECWNFWREIIEAHEPGTIPQTIEVPAMNGQRRRSVITPAATVDELVAAAEELDLEIERLRTMRRGLRLMRERADRRCATGETTVHRAVVNCIHDDRWGDKG